MPSVIQKIATEAQATFSKSRSDKSFSTSLTGLLQSVNKIRSLHLNIIPDAISKDAPLIGIPIFINDTFSLDAFVLQDGAKLPLHNHPDMYSISKVIHGTLKITSYNPVSSTSDKPVVKPDDIETQTESLNQDKDSLVPVELHMCKDMTYKDEPCLATPTVGNYHEIRAVNGTAVLFDIVSPPYKVCHMYSLLETKGIDSESKIWLSELANMAQYWYIFKEYKGPKISVPVSSR